MSNQIKQVWGNFTAIANTEPNLHPLESVGALPLNSRGSKIYQLL